MLPGRRHRRTVVLALASVVMVAAAMLALRYGRQLRSAATHWKGSPATTAAYRPLPAGAAVHVAVAGDVGDSGARLDATAGAMARVAADDPFDVLLLLGDNVYPAGDPLRLRDTVLVPFQPLVEGGAQLLAILGNHDELRGDEQLAALGMPGHWWSMARGDVLFVGLDSNLTRDSRQITWLKRTLAASTASWKIVAVHHPPYSAGYQGSSLAVRQTFGPVFERYGVQLVLSGHDHDYQRSKRIRGVTYVVTGAAAGTRRTGEAPFTAVSFSWHSFVEIGVYADRLVGRALNQHGRIADRWSIPLR